MPRIIISVRDSKAIAITGAVVFIVVPATGSIVIGIRATISAVVVSIVVSVAVAVIVLTRVISAIAATIIAIFSPCRLADYQGANN